MIYISIICFILLIGLGIYKNKGLPICISDIYYNIGHWFTALMWGIVLTMLPPMLEITQENFKIVGFVCLGSLLFVGTASDYKDEASFQTHKYGALISMISSIAWTILINPWALLVNLICLMGILDKERWILYIELCCFLNVMITMVLNGL